MGGVAAGILVTAAAAINQYGWGVGLLIGWLAGPVIGGAIALVVFLWLLPLQSEAPAAVPDMRGRKRVAAANGRNVSISVVMPVLNGKRFLERSLPPLLAMLESGEVMELLVVDDGSTDGSAEFAAARGATVVSPGGRQLGPGAGRNLAAEKARGDVLWFVDADIVAYPDGPSHIRRAFSEDQVVAVFGSYDDNPPELNFGSQYRYLLAHHHRQKANEEACVFWSGCGTVSRAAFLSVGGFDPVKYRAPSIEDVELGYRLRESGGKVKVDRDFLSTHLKRWTVAELVRTDVLRRVVPWCRLMMEKDGLFNALHVSGSERLRAALAAAIMVALIASLVGLAPLWAPPLLFVTAITTNWPLFRTFYRRGGPSFALLAIAFHQLYYLYSSCVFIFCWTESRLSQLARRRTRPSSRSRRRSPDGSAIA